MPMRLGFFLGIVKLLIEKHPAIEILGYIGDYTPLEE